MYSMNSKYYKIIYVGRPSVEKGLGDLLKALSTLCNYNWTLTIVGEIHPIINIESFFENNNNIINHVGPVQNIEMPALLNQHEIVVVPSHYENFGQIIIEAMACGKAVIAAETGGIKDIIIDKKNGLFFKPKNVLDLSSKIKYIFDNPEQIDILGHNASIYVKRYEWKLITSETIKIFKFFLR